MALPDVVYICQTGEHNEALRYSLRSLRNLPHGRVWIVGYKPKWVDNVGYIPTVQRGPKHANTWRNWQAAAGHRELSDRFVLFNDDFFVTRPIDTVPDLHRGPLDQMAAWYAKKRLIAYKERALQTSRLLRAAGRTDLLSYELHTPMNVVRSQLAQGLHWLDRHRTGPLENVSKRTFYGNMAGLGGQQARDVKVQSSKAGLPETALPFLSSSPLSWNGLTGGWVRRAFPDPSPYERGTSASRLYRPKESTADAV
jgi:hypothetical protein